MARTEGCTSSAALVIVVALLASVVVPHTNAALPPMSSRALDAACDASFVGRVMHVIRREVAGPARPAARRLRHGLADDGDASDLSGSDGEGDGAGDTDAAPVLPATGELSDYAVEAMVNVRSVVRRRWEVVRKGTLCRRHNGNAHHPMAVLTPTPLPITWPLSTAPRSNTH